MLQRPSNVFDRVHEWDDLARFALDDAAGLRIGIVRGRRRHGKSFLLEHLCRATGGAYTLALRQSRSMALDRFSSELSDSLGYRLGRFESWVQALDSAVEAMSRAAGTGPPLLVLDEFPYLVAGSPELPSTIQALYDRRGPSTGHPPFKLVLCGSAISVMSTLLSGDQALRGRAVLDIRMGPFRFRDAANYWQSSPETALLIDAVLGGAPGYRDIVGDPPSGPDRFFPWLERSLLNPSHILFNEPDYLLAEDPRIGDRTIYHAIWDAVSSGATTPTQIGALIGMDAKSLTYHLSIMRDAQFIRNDQDLLLQRRPVITVADPAVRFHNLIVRPNLAQLEIREADAAWARSEPTFSAKIVGPHFEDLAREWVRWYGREAGLDDVGQVGTTVVACQEHQGHEVDVIALDRTSMPRTRAARITLLGEAKATNRLRSSADLRRLEHIRDLLVAQGWQAAESAFAIFSRTGFDPDLATEAAPGRVVLIDLEALYGER
jgi:AAA+ ATPase superfamily predicted ATPase